jgi:hypothetical protein
MNHGTASITPSPKIVLVFELWALPVQSGSRSKENDAKHIRTHSVCLIIYELKRTSAGEIIRLIGGRVSGPRRDRWQNLRTGTRGCGRQRQ